MRDGAFRGFFGLIAKSGVGDSDVPLQLKYSTSDMAKDTLELCNHLGWTKQKQLHIIGVSMGG
jgi:pimeloyl-ACP methyl ester carboxylesterase